MTIHLYKQINSEYHIKMNTNITIDVRSPEFFQDYSFYIPKLPETEKLLLVYAEQGLTQKEIAQNLHLTQGAISSRISRIKKRLRFLKKLYTYNWENIDDDLGRFFSPLELELFKGMIETTCQSETARRLNIMFNLQESQRMNQVKVRHKFNLCSERLKKIKMDESLKTNYVHILWLIRNNLYCLHEIRLSQHDHLRSSL